jgi:hypothetical protein
MSVDKIPNVTIRTKSNADWFKTFQWLQGLEPLRLNGVLVLQVRKSASDSKTLFDLSSAPDKTGITIEDLEQGRFSVHFPKNSLDDLAPGQYVQDLVFQREDGINIPLWEGTLEHRLGVSR